MKLGLDRRLRKHGVSHAQWRVMMAIGGGEVRTAADITRIVGIDGTAITRLIDRLETKGLVRRSADPADRRANPIELTEAGRELYPKLKAEADANHAAVFGSLNEEEERRLRSLLTRILDGADR